MSTAPLRDLPEGSDVFIDANVFVHGLSGASPECQMFERCSREEVTGVTLFEVVSEATHRFMLADAGAYPGRRPRR